ncbi:MAG: hypothetical protein LBN39_11595 [Planctomycetaceae bacterium]|jgi:hypothetical protein|nr:hypothetical protein [Planctomycetaceae bacterium]
MKPFIKHNPVPIFVLLFAGLGTVCALIGCQSLPRSGLDPYGERLFESCPLNNLLPDSCPLKRKEAVKPSVAIPPQTQSATPPNQPATVYQPETAGITDSRLSTPATLPGNLGANGGTLPGVYGSTATILGNTSRGINTAIVQTPANETRRVFEETGGYALPTQPIEGPCLLMTPREQIAPVGSEVILVASYLGTGDHLITNEKVEWTLEGAGVLEQFDPGSICDPLHFDYVRAKKITDRFAVTKTSQLYQTIDRGTTDTKDDLHLLKGQTWISVNSMREGTSHITAFAPNMGDWAKRTDAGIIHWVDAQWVLPRLPIAPVGESRVLTTTLLRQTNGQPRKGWIVRYEILNGPAAGFGSSNYQIEEVETDISGQASVQLIPKELTTGTNTISVQIIRPAGVDGSDRRVTVGSETIRQTWSGSAGIRPVITGPSSVRRGQDIPYTITLKNSTGTVGKGILVMEVPPLATYINSTPAGQLDGGSVLWNVEVLPQGTAAFQVILRAGNVSGDIFPKAWFYPQGTQPVLPSTTTGQTPPPKQPDTANAVSTIPSTPATTFPDNKVPGSLNNPQNGASVYAPKPETQNPVNPPPVPGIPASGLKLNLRLDTPKPATGKPFEFYFTAENTGTTDKRNVRLQISLPPEFARRTLRAAANPGEAVQYNKENIVVLDIPVLAAKQTATLHLEYPDLPRQGYQITGQVFVNNLLVDKTPPLTVVP